MQRPSTNPHGLGIDHLLFLSRDLETSAATLERLGFTIAPRSTHSPHLGTVNRTVMFQRDYLEIIAVGTPTPHNQLHRDNLQRGEGCNIAAITTDSIDATRAALAAAGIPTNEPVDFSRPIELPGGAMGEAAFQVVRPARESLPNGFMFFCQHRTPQTVWVDEWTRHANSARRIAAVIIASDDPAETAQLYSTLFAPGARTGLAGGVAIETGKARLEFLKPEAIEQAYGAACVGGVSSPHFKAVRIEVEDISAARAAMEGSAVGFIAGDCGPLLVPPSAAGGTVMEFVSPGMRGRTG
ncbi:MAG: VOC family protein [Flavobacteriaceae bacterium]